VLPGVPEALRRLNEAGVLAIVVSNQRGIARGLYTAAEVAAIHAKFQQLLERAGAHIDGFFICPHDKGECNCRKPLPGLFEQAVAQFPEITAETSAMIGDSLSDVEFGWRQSRPICDALRSARLWMRCWLRGPRPREYVPVAFVLSHPFAPKNGRKDGAREGSSLIDRRPVRRRRSVPLQIHNRVQNRLRLR
jgi:histidinol-phosphate phosphatase family protein